MHAPPSTPAPVPGHVPPHLVYDFDVYHPPGGEEDYQQAWKRLHDDGAPDLLWTPRNGGHWLPIRGEDIYFLYQDWQDLSTEQYFPPKQSNPPRILPIFVDPPEHKPYRDLIQAPLVPKEVDRIEPFIREVVRQRIDSVIAAGGCEFITQFANFIPVSVFLRMTGLPQEDGPLILGLAEEQIYLLDEAARAETHRKIDEYVGRKIAERRGKAGDDRLTRLVNARVNGQPLTDDELKGLCHLLLIGGLDTVASMIGFIMHFLAGSAPHCRALAGDPDLIPKAIDEFLRRFGLTIPGRMARHDFVYKGVQIKAGDLFVLPTMLHGLDERKFSDPLEIRFDRTEKPIYSTFGNGVHRCPGSYLARTEIRLVLEEWLQRIPDFSLKPGEKIHIRTGMHGSVTNLPLVW